MATYGSTIRRGLPRVAGADAWPPAGVAPIDAGAGEVPGGTSIADAGAATSLEAASDAAPGSPVAAHLSDAVTGVAAAAAVPAVPVRRGLPRTPGGEPWPPQSEARPAASLPSGADAGSGAASAPVAAVAAGEAPSSAPLDSAASAPVMGGVALRRGLPRVSGGDPWPPAGLAAIVAAAPVPSLTADVTAPAVAPITATSPGADSPPSAPASAPAVDTVPARRAPLTVPRTVWPGKTAFVHPSPPPEPERHGPFTRGQWVGVILVGGAALLVAAALAVAFVRAFLSLGFMQDFLTTYPGEYHLPEGAPVGLPAWLGWQHFFNVFLMILIIRSGLQVRTEKRPTVFWASRRRKKSKMSLALWFHQSLDLLWLINGAVFIVLLFVTGQWLRIIPTSWEVFPNALSAALQYVSLDWPTENGWVNYNALQQLAYFATVFLAAPLAAITGFRMSPLWPKNATSLSRAYPIEWARAVHFPVMLYFVVFIVIHVALVLATGALRNLNHMYAAQGSVDPTAYADNWTGFWMFVLSLAVIAGAWIAARPLVLAPIARLFGTVSGR